MKKQHYYSFAFSYSEENQVTTTSIYVGYDHKYISIPKINDAKEGAGINKEAVMLSCCYLGKMTEEEIRTGIISRSTLARKAARVWDKLKLLVGFSGK